MDMLQIPSNDAFDMNAVTALTQYLLYNTILQTLNLNRLSLDDRAGICIANSLLWNTTLTFLDLRNNRLGERSVFSLQSIARRFCVSRCWGAVLPCEDLTVPPLTSKMNSTSSLQPCFQAKFLRILFSKKWFSHQKNCRIHLFKRTFSNQLAELNWGIVHLPRLLCLGFNRDGDCNLSEFSNLFIFLSNVFILFRYGFVLFCDNFAFLCNQFVFFCHALFYCCLRCIEWRCQWGQIRNQ